ncbi:MAG: OprD family outer membrane porin, partial [Arenimonas sp.]|nr:OprD family outer membrane porin [Arenimonas sp.]
DVVEEVESEGPSSVEEGHVEMDESFEPLTRREKGIKQRKQAFEDTKADVQLRTYYFDRDRFDGSQNAAWALGGYAGFKTGWFRDRFAVGATAYTSQRLYGPEDKDGTGLLQAGQQGYSVLGEAYAQFRFTDTVSFDVGRKRFNSPYVNPNDSRMTPNSFEMAMLQGVIGDSGQGDQWRFGLGYIGSMKTRTSEIFEPMSQVAGAPSDVDRGVTAAGVNFERGRFSIGAVDYYSDDIINIFYTEAKYDIPLSNGHKLKFGAQYSAQDSTGADLLTGSSFSTWQYGFKAEYGAGGALFTTAWNANGNGADLRSPWGGIPSYNAVQVQDFNRAGEDSVMLRAAYEFKSVKGLSMHWLWVNGSQPSDPSQSARDEFNFNLRWRAREGALNGLSVRLRYAVVTQDIGGPDMREFRLIVNYDPPSL